MTNERAAELLYNAVHRDGYENTWRTANDRGKWRTAIAELFQAMNDERA